jgi:hypothetical protein
LESKRAHQMRTLIGAGSVAMISAPMVKRAMIA